MGLLNLRSYCIETCDIFSLQQVLIMRDLPRMFSRLLADSNQLIHQVALENFARFAEETIHETIVADSLQSDERTQTSVVTYLNHVRMLVGAVGMYVC